ncbi:hypothetical protein [Mycolicibacterium austroafricanum]|uniref:Uncharacterized protein n=1 Tax=Mycolicibacterium austroafricanum TaxID=39687 RepID=A0ABT8HKK5_MYCAO|nr:hypothetical protein [Mycolicibacterium austroafricanum]MDN4521289.1 hypothetical protein [Mycolicibacterium austroafricanum]QRZ08176.1 hypothetical protein JN090_06475 [Mycolicibacterium austroafricanum]
MNVDIKPHHVARVLAILCALPIFWVFVVQGVTTTTTYDVSAGDFSSSSDFGSQFAKVFIFVLLTAAFAIAEWYTRKNQTPWPPSVKKKLVNMGLTSADGPQSGRFQNSPLDPDQ